MTSSICSAETTSANINVFFNSANIKIGDKYVNIENINYNNTIYIPLRSFAEQFGLTTFWDAENKTITLKEISSSNTSSSGASEKNSGDLSFGSFVYIFSVALLISGAILLGQVVLFKNKNDFAFIAKYISGSENLYPGIKQLLYESWLTKVGLIYIACGIVIHFISAGSYNCSTLIKIIFSCTFTLILLIFGWWVCRTKTREQLPDIINMCSLQS